jgi:hypothetical protein
MNMTPFRVSEAGGDAGERGPGLFSLGPAYPGRVQPGRYRVPKMEARERIINALSVDGPQVGDYPLPWLPAARSPVTSTAERANLPVLRGRAGP